MYRKYTTIALLVVLMLSVVGCSKVIKTPIGSPEASATGAPPSTQLFEDVRTLYAGNGYSMMIKDDGSLWSWGGNDNYRLGTGKYNGSTTPQKIMDSVKMVGLGSNAAFALKDDGTLWGWGSSAYINGEGEAIKEPVQIANNVTTVKAAESVVLYLTSDGTLYGFGSTRLPLLGEEDGFYLPVKLFSDIKDYWCNDNFALILKKDNSLWGWGSDYSGQLLGNATEIVEDGTGFEYPFHRTLVKLQDDVKTAVAGNGYVAVVDQNGTLYTWGDNSAGQLGNGGLGAWYDRQYGGRYLKNPTPTAVMTEVEFVWSGGATTAVLKQDGSLWLFGSNSSGKLGDGTTIDAAVPVKILDGVANVSMSRTHIFALMNDASVYAWGSDQNGEFGTGYSTTITEPVKILGNIQSASTYSGHTLAVSTDGKLYSFGDNEFGQLGDGTMIPSSTPAVIMTDVMQAAAANVHSMALLKTGELMTWGSNGSGQLGNGKQDETYYGLKYRENGIPVLTDYQGNKIYVAEKTVHQPEVVMTDVTAIAAHWSTSYALKSSGDLYGFGWDEMNQLGDDLRTNSALPKLITSGIKAISPPYAAISTENKLIYWGYNLTGYGFRTPTAAMDNVEKVTCNNFDLILTTDGMLKIVGYLPFHLSGPDSPTSTETPLDIAKDVIAFDANENNLFFIDKNQTLYAAKYNDIKLSTEEDPLSGLMLTAEAYKVMENISSVVTGLNHVLFITNDGDLYGYGNNDAGQLGDGKRVFVPQKISA